MRDEVEDHLLREAVVLEVNAEGDLPQIAAAYDRLRDAGCRGERLADVLGPDVASIRTDEIAAILATMGPDGSGTFSRSVTSLESLHGLARLLDALLELAVMTAADVDAFLEYRAQSCRRRITSGDDEEPAVGILDDRLDSLVALTPTAERWDLFHGLAQLGVLGTGRAERLYTDLAHADQAQTAPPEIWEVGPMRATLLGPPERYCGMRVLAVELCRDGVVVHVHWAINAADAHGSRAPLADEAAAGVPPWPLAPELHLHDSAGTAYRGAVAGAGTVDADDLGEGSFMSNEPVAFAPAMPADAERLWLASGDGRLRIDLR